MQQRTRAIRLGMVLFGALWLAALACAPASAAPLPNCWDIAYAALHHRAAAAHPPFILYNESSQITDGGSPLLQTRKNVAYRDDGVSRVWDERFSYEPYVTRANDPGPPELGPYGARRSIWLPVQEVDASLPLIGQVRAHNPNGLSCTTDGIETYRGHRTYRLSFTTTHPERPALKALWVDTGSSEIWKVILSGLLPITLDTDENLPRLADFEIELDQVDAYVVVDHVTWKYRYHAYAQYSELFGEYYYTGFQFPQTLPEKYFS